MSKEINNQIINKIFPKFEIVEERLEAIKKEGKNDESNKK